MDFLELAHNRRSVRKFEERKVEKEVIRKVLDATLTAPSSKNMRTTRIAVTEDKQIIEVISRMRSRSSSFVKNAPLVFIIMADNSQTDLWRENCAISATVLQFAAESVGLGSCWVHVNGRPHNEDRPDDKTASEYLRENIPGLPDYKIMCVVAAGYPLEPSVPHSRKDASDKVLVL